jgi:hypothetical protein
MLGEIHPKHREDIVAQKSGGGGKAKAERPNAERLGFDPAENPYPLGSFAHGAWLRMQERLVRDRKYAETAEGKESARFHGVRTEKQKMAKANPFAEPVRGADDWTTQHSDLDEETADGTEGQS